MKTIQEFCDALSTVIKTYEKSKKDKEGTSSLSKKRKAEIKNVRASIKRINALGIGKKLVFDADELGQAAVIHKAMTHYISKKMHVRDAWWWEDKSLQEQLLEVVERDEYSRGEISYELLLTTLTRLNTVEKTSGKNWYREYTASQAALRKAHAKIKTLEENVFNLRGERSVLEKEVVHLFKQRDEAKRNTVRSARTDQREHPASSTVHQKYSRAAKEEGFETHATTKISASASG